MLNVLLFTGRCEAELPGPCLWRHDHFQQHSVDHDGVVLRDCYSTVFIKALVCVHEVECLKVDSHPLSGLPTLLCRAVLCCAPQLWRLLRCATVLLGWPCLALQCCSRLAVVQTPSWCLREPRGTAARLPR